LSLSVRSRSRLFDVPEHVARAESRQSPSRKSFLWLTLTAVGVVHGDIGTSPLYALSSCLAELAPTSCVRGDGACVWPERSADVVGLLSLMLWTVTLVGTVQFACVALSLDCAGEGGTLALASQISEERGAQRWLKTASTWAALVAAGFVVGDACLTPAISVLSSVEGIGVADASFAPAAVPVSCVLLLALFSVQRFGTARVAFLFGPIAVLWFVAVGAIGVWQMAQSSEAAALAWSAWNPAHAVGVFQRHGFRGFMALDAVVLTVTGVEAMFADLGHFGAWPSRAAWLALVFPALVLSYVGQAAFVLTLPAASASFATAFFSSVPRALLWPMIVLAVLETVIASQAMISGAFSFIVQSIQLDNLPRVRVVHTSASQQAQVYVPFLNGVLLVVSIALVVAYERASALKSAYGLAVSALLLLISLLGTAVLLLRCRSRRRWLRAPVALGGATFVLVAGAFFVANVIKVPSGGWVSLAIGGGVVVVTIAWRLGRRWKRAARIGAGAVTVDAFCEQFVVERADIPRIADRVGVFATAHVDAIPVEFVRFVEFAHTLPHTVVFLTIVFDTVPYVAPAHRCELARSDAAARVFSLVLRFGFAEHEHDVRHVLLHSPAFLRIFDSETAHLNVAFYLAKSRALIDARRPLPHRAVAWLYSLLADLQVNLADHLQLPLEATIEITSVLKL
jgi:KUP system potassium uptake protein